MSGCADRLAPRRTSPGRRRVPSVTSLSVPQARRPSIVWELDDDEIRRDYEGTTLLSRAMSRSKVRRRTFSVPRRSRVLDEIDKRIVELLQGNTRASNAMIGKT